MIAEIKRNTFVATSSKSFADNCMKQWGNAHGKR